MLESSRVVYSRVLPYTKIKVYLTIFQLHVPHFGTTLRQSTTGTYQQFLL